MKNSLMNAGLMATSATKLLIKTDQTEIYEMIFSENLFNTRKFALVLLIQLQWTHDKIKGFSQILFAKN